MEPVLDYADREIHPGQTIAYATSSGGMGVYKVVKVNRNSHTLSATEYFQSNIGEPFYRHTDKTVCLKFPAMAIILPDGYFDTREEIQ